MKFRKLDKIEFISTVDGLESIEECLPRPAKHFIPKWFKDMPSQTENSTTVKVCPSFPDYFSQGYIIPMWSDVKLESKGDAWNWSVSDPDNPSQWSNHGSSQFLNYTKATFNGVDGQFVFKAISPWKIVTPPGWSVLQLPLFYHFNQEWSVLPGVIDTDIYSEINQQIQKITKNGQETYDSQTPERKTNMAELARQYIQLNEEREKIDNTINDYQTLDQQQIQGDLTANKNYYSFVLLLLLAIITIFVLYKVGFSFNSETNSSVLSGGAKRLKTIMSFRNK